MQFTFWIDKQTKLIRKSRQRVEGERSAVPGARYSGVDEKLYEVAEIDVAHFPDQTFTFAPPSSAILVKAFEDKQTQEQGKFVGQQVAALTFKNPEGKEVGLQSFAGKTNTSRFLDYVV